MSTLFSKILEAIVSFFGKYVISHIGGWITSAINKIKRTKEQKVALEQYDKSVKEKADLEKRVKDAEDLLNSGSH